MTVEQIQPSSPPRTVGVVTPALSPSRAADFMQCPLLYRFRVVDRLPEPPSPAAARGTLVHAVLERLFDVPGPERTLRYAVSLVPGEWAKLVEDQPDLAEMLGAETALEDWYGQAADLVESWFGLEDPTRLEPADRELKVQHDVDGLLLRGIIDRLDVAPTGELRVVDYKTGRSPSERFEGRYLFQMRFYALVLWRSRGVVPHTLQLVFLRNGEILRYQPDEADLVATERKVLALWSAIERAAGSGDWRPSPSRLCDWCNHRAICPAFGGTPPPLPTDAAIRAVDPHATGSDDPADG